MMSGNEKTFLTQSGITLSGIVFTCVLLINFVILLKTPFYKSKSNRGNSRYVALGIGVVFFVGFVLFLSEQTFNSKVFCRLNPFDPICESRLRPEGGLTITKLIEE